MKRTYTINERYRPIVTVKKIKKDIPTVIEVSGRRYVYEASDTHKKGKRQMDIRIVRADGIWEIQITKNKSTNFIVLDKTQMVDLYNMIGDELYIEETGLETL